MTFSKIRCYGAINKVDSSKVEEIKKSILTNGFIGCPILFVNDLALVTGSHRWVALNEIEEECLDIDSNFDIGTANVCEDVTDIVNDYCESEECTFEQIDFSNLRPIFAGTWVEQYKDELEEW